MEEIVAYTVDGKPLTLKEYKEKLDSALERVKSTQPRRSFKRNEKLVELKLISKPDLLPFPL